MTETETIRIEMMNDDERNIINVLTHQERKEALLKAGQIKMQSANKRLFIEKFAKTPEFEKSIRPRLEEIGRSLQDVTSISFWSDPVEGPTIDGWATWEPGPFIIITLHFTDGSRAQHLVHSGTFERVLDPVTQVDYWKER